MLVTSWYSTGMSNQPTGESRIDLRVPAALKPELVRRAKDARQSLNSWIVTVLEREAGVRK